ncbi:MAG: Flp pilus assembly protein CpaB [Candidatus Omnitrophota bacterium]
MSKAAAILVLFIAILSGLFASAAVMKYVQNQRRTASSSEAGPLTSVAVAQKDIPAGTAILAEHVMDATHPKSLIPAGAIDSQKLALNRMAKTAIYKGEILVQERLTEPGAPSGLSSLIPEGQRAITLRVDDTIGVGGFVQPGHHVDIVTTVDLRGETNETVCKVILQNLQVIATGQEIDRKDRKENEKPKTVPTVTVLATPEQAEKLTLAANAGVIRLILRNFRDNAEEITKGIRLSNLIADARPSLPPPEPVQIQETAKAPETPAKKFSIIEVYRGAQKSEVAFEK